VNSEPLLLKLDASISKLSWLCPSASERIPKPSDTISVPWWAAKVPVVSSSPDASVYDVSFRVPAKSTYTWAVTSAAPAMLTDMRIKSKTRYGEPISLLDMLFPFQELAVAIVLALRPHARASGFLQDDGL